MIYAIYLHGVQTEDATENMAEKPFEDYRQEHGDTSSDICDSDGTDTDSTFSGLSSSTDTSSNDDDFVAR